MEPLPATQDALRLELRSARSLEVRHLLLPSFVPSYHAARGTTIDSRVPPRHRHRRHRSHRRLSTFPTFPSSSFYVSNLPIDSRSAGKP